MSREVLQQALAVLKGCLEHPDAQDSIVAIEHELAQQEHPEQMARLGWQYFECPACGSEGARAFPKPEQGPVAWGCNRYIEDDNGFQIGTDEPELAWGKYAPDDNGWWPLYTSPPQRQPLTEEQAKNLLRIGPVYAPDGAVTRTPLAYRKELLETALWALRKAEAAHGIGDKT